MRKSILTGSLAAAIVFGLAGCGGSGDDLPDSTLPDATAEFTKDDTSTILSTYSIENLKDPSNLLYDLDNNSSLAQNRMLGAPLAGSIKTYQCSNGGSATFETISGVDPHDEASQSVTQSVWKYKFEYNNCDYSGTGITKTAKGEGTNEWTRSGQYDTDNYSYSSKYSGNNIGDAVYKSETAEMKVSFKWNGEYNETEKSESGKYHNEYSGELTTNDKKRTIEFKSIKTDSYWSEEESSSEETEESSFSASGAVNDSKYNGWIVFRTDKEFKRINDCMKEGKATIIGKEHTITVEVVDEKIVYKFDDEVQKTEPACD